MAKPKMSECNLSPRHISKSLENIQIDSHVVEKSSERECSRDLGHRRSQSQCNESVPLCSFSRSLSHQPQHSHQKGRTDVDDLTHIESLRMVIVSSKVRTISSLKHALQPGVILLQYNCDTQTLSDLQTQIEQLLKGRKIASVAFILSCSGSSLQLMTKEDKSVNKDGHLDRSVEEFFVFLVRNHFLCANFTCRIDFLCWYSLQSNDVSPPIIAELQNVTGVTVTVWKDLSGSIPNQLDDGKPVGEIYFRLEKLRNWSGRHQQSLAGFEKIRTVGKGAYGAAVLYKKKDDESLVILKEINLHELNVSERQMALNEVNVLAMLDHPNIISYYDSFEEDGVLMIEMEYADNGTLAQFLAKQEQPLTEREILSMFQQIVAAIRHIHSHNILHRDLKTDNIFLTKEGVIKIGDFGISKMMSSANKGAQTVLGTPYYISPEMCEGKQYSFKSDIWALGCILYEMACLQKTFEGSNLPALVNKIMKGQFTPVKGNYSEELKELIGQMLNKDPESRPEANSIMYQLLPTLMDKAGGKKSDIDEDVHSSESLKKKCKLRSVLYYLEAATGTLTCVDNLPPRMRIKQMAVGPDHVVVTTSERQVFTWGQGGCGQLGHGDMEVRASPVLVDALKGKSISLVGCGLGFTVFGSDNGLVLTCGDGTYGCLGHGDWCRSTRPRLVESLLSVDVRAMACGLRHVVVLGRGGEVMSWGDGTWGQLGLGSESTQCLPSRMQIAEAVVFTDVQCNQDGTMLISDVGGVFACGSNEYNKLGLNNRQGFLMAMKNIFTKTEVDGKNVPTPVRALARHRVVSVAMGSQHTAVVVEPGHVITFGRNSEGQLGAQNTKPLSSLVEVKTLQEHCVCKVQCGEHYSVATTKSNQLYYWGLRFTTPPRYCSEYHTQVEAQSGEMSNQIDETALGVQNKLEESDLTIGSDPKTCGQKEPEEGSTKHLDSKDNNSAQADTASVRPFQNDKSSQAAVGLDAKIRPEVRGFRPLTSLPRRSWSVSSQDKDSCRDENVIVYPPIEPIKLKQGHEKMILGNVYCHGENMFIQVETTAPPPRRRTFKKRVVRRNKSDHGSHQDKGENSSETSELDNNVPTWLRQELAHTEVNDGNEADHTSADSDNPIIDSSMSSIQVNRAMTPVTSEIARVYISPRMHQNRDRGFSLNSSESWTDPHLSDSSSGEVKKCPQADIVRPKTPIVLSQPKGKLNKKATVNTRQGFNSAVVLQKREERLLFQLERMKEEKKASDARVRLLERERENQENLVVEKAREIVRERELVLLSQLEQLKHELQMQTVLLTDRDRKVSELHNKLETLQSAHSGSGDVHNSQHLTHRGSGDVHNSQHLTHRGSGDVHNSQHLTHRGSGDVQDSKNDEKDENKSSTEESRSTTKSTTEESRSTTKSTTEESRSTTKSTNGSLSSLKRSNSRVCALQ